MRKGWICTGLAYDCKLRAVAELEEVACIVQALNRSKVVMPHSWMTQKKRSQVLRWSTRDL